MSAIEAIRHWWYGPWNRTGVTSMEVAKALSKALHDAGYVIVPIKPTERMIEELASIGDGPMISGEECWGYMLAAAIADDAAAGGAEGEQACACIPDEGYVCANCKAKQNVNTVGDGAAGEEKR